MTLKEKFAAKKAAKREAWGSSHRTRKLYVTKDVAKQNPTFFGLSRKSI